MSGARVVRARCFAVIRVPFARHRHSLARSCRVFGSRVDHACRAASARDNKLFSFINTHVNNVNSSGHIF